MAAQRTPNHRQADLLHEYAQALQAYVSGAQADGLERARRLGAEALRAGLGALEIAALHHRATMTLFLGLLPEEEAQRAVAALGRFCISCPAWEVASELNPSLLPGVEAVFTAALSPLDANNRRLKQSHSALLRLNELREEEAKRIAHALHDEAAQLLASVHLALEDLALGLSRPNRERIQIIRERLDQVGEQLRGLAHELRPTILDDLGLVPAVEFLAQSISSRTAIPILVEGAPQPRVAGPIETALYRIVQEALTNITKHAQARLVQIRFRQSARLIACAIRDDGIGFDVAEVLMKPGARGLGLLGMRERIEPLGGTLLVSSEPGRGSEIVASVPLEARRSLSRTAPA